MYNFLGWKNSWGSILDPTHPESLDLVICPSFLDPHKQLLGEMDTNPENLQMAGNRFANELANGMSQIQPREMIPMFKHQTMAPHGLTFVHHEPCPPLTLTMKPDLVKHNLLWGSSIHEILKLYCIYNYHYYTHIYIYIQYTHYLSLLLYLYVNSHCVFVF